MSEELAGSGSEAEDEQPQARGGWAFHRAKSLHRSWAGVSAVGNGQAVVVGGVGVSSGAPSKRVTVLQYTKESVTVEKEFDLPYAVSGLVAFALGGRVFAHGGVRDDGTISADTLVLDIARGGAEVLKSETGNSPSCAFSTATVVNGNAYLVGGIQDQGAAHVYKFDGSKWSKLASKGKQIPSVSQHCCAANGKSLLVAGGVDNDTGSYNTEVFTFSTESFTWRKLGVTDPDRPLVGASAVLVRDRMFVIGGYGSTDSIAVLDIGEKKWLDLVPTGDRFQARYGHGVAISEEMVLLVTGGAPVTPKKSFSEAAVLPISDTDFFEEDGEKDAASKEEDGGVSRLVETFESLLSASEAEEMELAFEGGDTSKAFATRLRSLREDLNKMEAENKRLRTAYETAEERFGGDAAALRRTVAALEARVTARPNGGGGGGGASSSGGGTPSRGRGGVGVADELEAQIEDLNEDLASVKATNADLEAKLRHAREEVTALKKQREDVSEELKMAKEQQETLREELESSRRKGGGGGGGSFISSPVRSAPATEETRLLKRQSTLSEKRFKLLKGEMEEVEASRKQLREELEEMRKTRQELWGELKEAHRSRLRAEKELSDAQSMIETLQSSTSTSKSAADSEGAVREELQRKLSALTDENQRLLEQLDRAIEAASADAASAVRRLRAELEEARELKEQYQNELHESESTRKVLLEELKTLRAK